MALDYSAPEHAAPAGQAGTGASARESGLARSRMAVLSLADRMAVSAMPCLAVIFIGMLMTGIINLSLAPSFGAGMRTLLWMGMVGVPLAITARRLRRYRLGGGLAARPLTWRAGHSAAVGTLSVALGCGALMLTAGGVSTLTATFSLVAVSMLILALAAGHLAHGRTALAAGLPGGIGLLSSLAVHGPALSETISGLTGLITISAVALFGSLWAWRRHRQLVVDALDHHPRRERAQITARRKKAPRAYNPYRLSAKETERPRSRPYLYRPSEL